MSRQGRILVVDDLPQWRRRLTRTLQQAGFAVDSAASVQEALEKLDSALYHLAVLDIRMVDPDPANVEGMDLLRELSRRGSLSALKIVMLSNYGTKELMREAFARHGVKEFFEKDSFGKGSELREKIVEIFREEIGVNLDLEIVWEPQEAREQVAESLRLGGKRVKGDSALVARIAEEVEDLLCRLFPEARQVQLRPFNPGLSGAVALWAQWQTARAAAEPAVVKIGDFQDIQKEYQNFKTYVEGFVGGNRNTVARRLQQTPRLGGILYSFVGVEGERLEDFGTFYRRSDLTAVRELLDRLFLKTCSRWYGNPEEIDELDLNAEYRTLLGFSAKNLERAVREMLKSVQGSDRLSFQSLDGGGRAFTNPIAAAAEKRLVRSTFKTVTHGDFNQHNILVDEVGNPWLIDFLRTGSGHVLRDVAQLDAVVRLELLGPAEATLAERLALEEALSRIDRFQQVADLAGELYPGNPALAKAYGTSVHLRRLAARLVADNPKDDFSEYLAASLYYALNAIRFYSLKKVQREHALLSASLLADRIGL